MLVINSLGAPASVPLSLTVTSLGASGLGGYSVPVVVLCLPVVGLPWERR